MRLAGYTGQSVAPGAKNQGGSTSQQRSSNDALLEDLQRRFNMLLTRVIMHGWHELEDLYTYECTGLSLEWRGIMRHIIMSGQAVRDLWASGMEPLAREPLDDSD